MAKKETIKEIKERLNLEESISQLIREQTKDISSFLSLQAKFTQFKKNQLDIEKEIGKFMDTEGNLLKDLTKEQKEYVRSNQDLLKYSKLQTSQLSKQLNFGHLIKAGLGTILSTTQELVGLDIKRELSVKGVLSYMIDQDKIVKSMNLQLGLSGERAKGMSKSFRETQFQAAILGATMEDIVGIQDQFAETTGRVRQMTVGAQNAILEIGKGTGLGTKRGSELAANFENIGINAEKSNQMVQDIVSTSERMGLNTNKILNSVIDHFKIAQKFYFKQGIKGLAQMASHAEKFKVDITETFAAATKAKTLEGAINMASTLRVAGSEFSKVDPFKLLYESRTNVAAFQKSLQEMTKGLAFMNKEGELTIAAAGISQLEIVSDATGQSLESLILTAKRTKEIELMRKSIPGLTSMNQELQDLVEGMTRWNTQTKKFEITDPFTGQAKSIGEFSKTELEAFAKEKESLKNRAIDAQSLDMAFKNMVVTLKSAFLPLTDLFNKITKGIQWSTEMLGKFGPMIIATGVLLTGLFTSKLLFGGINKLVGGILGLNGGIGKLSGAASKMPKGGLMGSIFGGISSGGMLKGSVALLAVGASLILFAYAMKLMGEATDKGASFLALAGGLTVMSVAVIALGAAMATGFGAAGLALGVGAIAAMGASVLPLAYAMKTLGEANMSDIGFGFKTISSSVNAIDSKKLEEIRLTAEALKGLSEKNNVFSQLKDMFKDSLKVEFKDKTVSLNIDITNELDGDKLSRKTYQKTAELQFESNYYNKA